MPDKDPLDEVLEILDKMEETIGSIANLSREGGSDKRQAIHDIDKQVLWRTSLKVGEVYMMVVGRQKKSAKVKLVSEPYQDEKGNWIATFENTTNNHKADVFLAELGITPYINKTWSKYHHLMVCEQ